MLIFILFKNKLEHVRTHLSYNEHEHIYTYRNQDVCSAKNTWNSYLIRMKSHKFHRIYKSLKIGIKIMHISSKQKIVIDLWLHTRKFNFVLSIALEKNKNFLAFKLNCSCERFLHVSLNYCCMHAQHEGL